jgi:hypothetical protein
MELLVNHRHLATHVNVLWDMLACDVINVNSSICALQTLVTMAALVKHKAERRINTQYIVYVQSNTPAHVVKHE